MLALLLSSLILSGAEAVKHSIPLHRRSSIVPQGHLHPHKRAVRFADAEQRREAFERIGREAERVRRKYGKTLAGSSSSSTSTKRASADVSFYDADQDLEYFVPLQIGTPAQTLNVTVDTGSADLWIPSSSCTVGCTSNMTFYNPSSSSSYTSTTNTITVEYGSGAVQGNLGYETLALGSGFSVSHAGFIVASEVQDLLESDVPVSGLMGFGWQTISESQSTPYWQAVLSNGSSGTTFDEPAFSIALARAPGSRTDQQVFGEVDSGGSFVLGGWDETAINGGVDSVEWNSLTAEGYWQIPLSHVTVNSGTVGATGGSTATAAVDSGTTLIAAPSSAVQSIYSLIQDGQVIENGNGLWAYPYDATANVSITYSGKAWPISADDFCYYSFVASSQGSEGTWCVGAIFDGGTNLAQSNVPDFIMGDAFMKNVYTIFRASPAQVGFGVLADGAASASSGSSGQSGATGTAVSISNTVSYRGSTQTPGSGSGGGDNSGGTGRWSSSAPAAAGALVLAMAMGGWWTL